MIEDMAILTIGFYFGVAITSVVCLIDRKNYLKGLNIEDCYAMVVDKYVEQPKEKTILETY